MAAAVWAARIISFVAIYDATVLTMVGFRVLVTAVQVSAAVLLWQRRLPGVALAQIALVASAILLAIEIGLGLAPSSVPPGQRSLRVGAYAIYAALSVWLLRRASADR